MLALRCCGPHNAPRIVDLRVRDPKLGPLFGVVEDAGIDPGLPAGPGRGNREDPGVAGRNPRRAGQPARDFLTHGPWQVPTADARDGRRGNQPWSVITTPVSA